MVTTKIFQHRNTTSYIFDLDAAEQNAATTSPMAQIPSVVVPAASADDEAVQSWGEDVVEVIIGSEADAGGTVMYMVRFGDGGEYPVLRQTLLGFQNGAEALVEYESRSDSVADSDGADDIDDVDDVGLAQDASAEQSEVNQTSEEEEEVAPRRPSRGVKRQRPSSFVDSTTINLDDSEDELTTKKPRLDTRTSKRRITYNEDTQIEGISDDSEPKTRFGGRSTRSTGRVTRSSMRGDEPEYIGLIDESSDDPSQDEEDIDVFQSDLMPKKRSRRSGTARRSPNGREIGGLRYEHQGTRQSGRSTRNKSNMKEVGEDRVFRSESEDDRTHITKPKVVAAKESFKPLLAGNRFAAHHCQQCETCGKYGSGPYGQLIHCQGCSLSYHKQCLGQRATRDHLVTKIGDQDFVLQCRRCVSSVRRKEPTAPDQGMCQTCREIGSACHSFRKRKTIAQEERERNENDGEDPIAVVDSSLINNVSNVLFRCMSCWRGFHYHHLPPKSDDVVDVYDDEEELGHQRFQQYRKDWNCIECATMPAKVSAQIAWRPVDQDTYIPGLLSDAINEDDKQYLVKWEKLSYFKCQWMPGAWTWGVTSTSMRRGFERRNNGLPVMNTEDAIPEDYLRVDIVLDVKFTSYVEVRGEEIDKARIREVDKALIKYKGLGYEDAVWTEVPTPADGDRWSDFVSAYDDWVKGRYVLVPKSQPMKNRLDKARGKPFEELERKKQPEYITGGELMQYQIDGLNWLYYRWYQKKNAILADEMGLGKTIQIVSFLATLVEEHNCFPFLVVVPNSTCPNWRREIKRWAPNLRVVAYYGSAAARDAAYRYELFPEGSKELRCHIVVTSYDAAADDSCRKFFRSVPWQGLIVDEGQRLKNDKNLLYEALTNLKIPYKVLLTGTPLQNNARELFNLLQFLDDSFNAAQLELEYAELTKENVPQLHQLIRDFFLRRTKAQVLTFMPAMAQIILPVSMSVLQTKLYSSILAKNPDLIRAIFESSAVAKKGDRANLNNILMQLRKCLCHPFVYNREIEERSDVATVSHRNLVDASGKLAMLELLLPKLQQRGHRVLIFSQFLDMLDIMEDFLDGLSLKHQRLDGTISALEKQQRIDEYNAPDSQLFAFLLSTRAGGVGINLATADTVIILDPDFNPHQDIQALSRAHRIGQKNKVLCFQLMTRASAEERIVQIGRKKMALDHVLIERMDAEDDVGVDMESILRYGAAEILEGHTEELRYDESSIEKLLDRSQVEDTKAGDDNTAEAQFSFARVWANDAASMVDSLGSDDDAEKAPDPTRWAYILKERERVAAAEAATRQQVLGRGKRARKTVDYKTDADRERRDAAKDSSSDTDFRVEDKSEPESADEQEQDPNAISVEAAGLVEKEQERASRGLLSQSTVDHPNLFVRSRINWASTTTEAPTSLILNDPEDTDPMIHCLICETYHHRGHCPLKLAGAETCNICGMAHYGRARTCPHFKSETQVGAMLNALKQSTESRQLVDLAKKYLSGVKGTLVQGKKIKAEQAAARAAAALRQQQTGTSGIPGAGFGVFSAQQQQQQYRQHPAVQGQPLARESAPVSRAGTNGSAGNLVRRLPTAHSGTKRHDHNQELAIHNQQARQHSQPGPAASVQNGGDPMQIRQYAYERVQPGQGPSTGDGAYHVMGSESGLNRVKSDGRPL